MSEYFIEMKNISKKFHDKKVLENINFTLNSGEIRGLIGENGAGKSVLMQILSGVIKPDAGELYVNNSPVYFNKPEDALANGIISIYQDINIINNLSVAENIFINRLPMKGRLFKQIDWGTLYKESSKILSELNFDIDVRKLANELSYGQKRMLEIAKVVYQKARLIIMDEPYIGFTDSDIENFYDVIKRLKNSGISVIYISHKIEDIVKLCDSITIISNGHIVDNCTSTSDSERIIKLMTINDVNFNYPKLNRKAGRVVLKVNSIFTYRGLKNISFELKKGEIIGIAGLLGSGRTAIARALFGLDALISGEIIINDSVMNLKSPKYAIKNKIGYLTEDIQTSGIEVNMSIPENITLANISGITNLGIIDTSRENNIARSFIRKMLVKTSGVKQRVGKLSGGNQKKVMISKWIFSDSNILILDEPTKSIDTSTKVVLYNFMNNYILEGSSIIFISSELDELMGMSDKIIVLFNGEIRKTLKRDEFSKERIIYYASGGK
jgi:ribose transport system ATP-binding protein